MIVAFEGLPGAGKTTTARMLAARLQTACVIESTHDHPFLDSVYRDDARHDLEVELAFLLLHANAWRAIDRDAVTVTDFTRVKDLLFARDMLTVAEDLDVFKRAYSRLHQGSADADVVIYLRASPELALERVRGRYKLDSHRLFETSMELERLRRIEAQYEAQHDDLGRRVLDLELAELLQPDEDAQNSKDRVADAALELLAPHLPH
ncbi:MAG TPA: deoxynucleoside kinase [Solirubrobacteraceae bacterium]